MLFIRFFIQLVSTRLRISKLSTCETTQQGNIKSNVEEE